VIEDVVTTGGSTRETMAVAEAAGATVVAPAPSSIAAAARPT
jgi:orotate phosphoribosyltransferase